MAYRLTPFTNQSFYHIYNRGVEKRQIFVDSNDYQRFLETIHYYQFSNPKPRLSTSKRFRDQNFDKNPKIVEIICYCLMPNHFHLLIRQVKDGGIQEFASKLLNSYTKYFNTKHKRVGALFQGTFKAVAVDSDEQLLHLSRYIHLNPYVSQLTENLLDYSYSSYLEFIDIASKEFCVKEPILSFFTKNANKNYQKFVKDQKEYAREIEKIKHLLFSED